MYAGVEGMVVGGFYRRPDSPRLGLLAVRRAQAATPVALASVSADIFQVKIK